MTARYSHFRCRPAPARHTLNNTSLRYLDTRAILALNRRAGCGQKGEGEGEGVKDEVEGDEGRRWKGAAGERGGAGEEKGRGGGRQKEEVAKERDQRATRRITEENDEEHRMNKVSGQKAREKNGRGRQNGKRERRNRNDDAETRTTPRAPTRKLAK